MTGYSGTPLIRKLGITAESRVLVVGSPGAFDTAVALPGVTVRRRATGTFDVALLFCPDTATMTRRFADLVDHLATAGALWVCWPKRASGIVTDLSESDVRQHGLDCGLVDVKIAAVDPVWSGLKFVRRRADR